jgi:hypothetical protein
MATKYQIFEYTKDLVKIIIDSNLNYNDAYRLGVYFAFKKHTSVFIEPVLIGNDPVKNNNVVKITIENQLDIEKIEKLRKEGYTLLKGGFNYVLLKKD